MTGGQISKLGFKIWKPNLIPEPLRLEPKLGVLDYIMEPRASTELVKQDGWWPNITKLKLFGSNLV